MTTDVLPDGTARPHYPHDPLPDWVTELRDTQVTAVRDIIEAFQHTDIVYLDAPVGAGKTLIAELVRRELDVRHGLYVCSDRALQQQFLDDFPYARVLKGRSNYIPTNAPRDITCEDCTVRTAGEPCMWCEDVGRCPYRLARVAALGRKTPDGWSGGARVAVLNTAYMLAAGNLARTLRRYDLVVADECDLLEGALTGHIEYEVPQWIGDLLGLQYPKKGIHKETLWTWLTEAAAVASEYIAKHGASMEVKKANRLQSFWRETTLVARDLQREIRDAENGTGREGDGGGEGVSSAWVREYGSSRWPVRTLKLKPVRVDHHGPRMLWRHGQKWLLMSGTIVSAEELSDSLGQVQDYTVVTVPSTFPVENRPIISAPIANVTAKATEADEAQLIYAIEQILDKHEGRALVHTVSYKLTQMLWERVQTPRAKFRYTSAAGKYEALEQYLRTPDAVLFAPSMDRGVDLGGDACRIQIIAKVPFPNLGDKQVSARLRSPGGQTWYQVQAIRDIVQMTGRGVRHPDDTCVTYILDRQFAINLWSRRTKHLFPAYFRDALDERYRINDLIMPKRA